MQMLIFQTPASGWPPPRASRHKLIVFFIWTAQRELYIEHDNANVNFSSIFCWKNKNNAEATVAIAFTQFYWQCHAWCIMPQHNKNTVAAWYAMQCAMQYHDVCNLLHEKSYSIMCNAMAQRKTPWYDVGAILSNASKLIQIP